MSVAHRHLAAWATAVASFTILITSTTDLPFWIPLCVLTFNFIIAAWIGERFEKQNPHLIEAEPLPLHIQAKPLLIWSIVFAFVAWGVSWKWDLAYFTAFAYVFLIGTTSLSVNRILIDWEDNRPGGWNYPD